MALACDKLSQAVRQGTHAQDAQKDRQQGRSE
jgi:hypothetical protein